MAASLGVVVPVHAAGTRLAQAETDRRRLPKREDAIPVVPGVHVLRGNGEYVALAVENGRFVLRFLNAERRLQDRQAPRALLRWNPVGKVGESRTVLNPGEDSQLLVGTTPVKPPLNFKVNLTLIDGDDQALETLVFDFKP